MDGYNISKFLWSKRDGVASYVKKKNTEMSYLHSAICLTLQTDFYFIRPSLAQSPQKRGPRKKKIFLFLCLCDVINSDFLYTNALFMMFRAPWKRKDTFFSDHAFEGDRAGLGFSHLKAPNEIQVFLLVVLINQNFSSLTIWLFLFQTSCTSSRFWNLDENTQKINSTASYKCLFLSG